MAKYPTLYSDEIAFAELSPGRANRVIHWAA
jgi:hypothetical protein